jgi:alkyl hydroperoxide reductase subunit AhpF
MALLDENIVKQLKGFFDKITEDIKIISFLGESEKSKELDSFLNEVTDISDTLKYESYMFGANAELEELYGIKRETAFTLVKNNEKTGINFFGIPGGHEFNSFVLAILNLAGLGKKLDAEKTEEIKAINKPLNIEVFISLSCTHCPDVVQALDSIALHNENITVSMIDSGIYPKEAKEKDIQAVPTVFINDKLASIGAKTFDELLEIAKNS